MRLIDFETKGTCFGVDGCFDIRVYKTGKESPVFSMWDKRQRGYRTMG